MIQFTGELVLVHEVALSLTLCTDILLGAFLPLHAYLSENLLLSIKVVADGEVCGETPVANGDPKTGLWEFPSKLNLPEVKRSITFSLVSKRERIKLQFTSTTFTAAELLARLRRKPFGYHEFIIGEPHSWMQFLMSCSVKLAEPSIVEAIPPQVAACRIPTGHATNVTRNRQTGGIKLDPESGLPSRDTLESVYATARGKKRDDRASDLSLLGSTYYLLYRKSGSIADLEKAISMHEEATQHTSHFHPQRLNHFAVALQERFSQSGDIADIERAIQLQQDSLKATKDGDPEKLLSIGGLANAFHCRFQRLGQRSDMEKSAALLKQAMELWQDDKSPKLSIPNDLRTTLQASFERFGNMASQNEMAVELMPDGHPDKPRRLSERGIILMARFEQIGSLKDINDAIFSLQTAVDLTLDGRPELATRLNILGVALEARFKQLGSLADIENAVLCMQKALDLTPNSHPEIADRFASLGGALETRFIRLGNLADIDNAISLKEKAVELTPDGHPDKPGCLTNLGLSLRARFERLGSLADINNAISLKEKAVELMADDHPLKARSLNNLGLGLRTRFTRLGSLADIDKAVVTLQKSVDLLPEGHPDKPTCLNNLGSALQQRLERLGHLADGDNAVLTLQKAVDLLPAGHPEKQIALNNLAGAVEARFQRLGSLKDNDKAISGLQKVVDITPEGHPEKPARLSNLGRALLHRFERLPVLKTLERALQNYAEAARSSTGPAIIRFSAARTWAEQSNKYFQSPLPAYDCAIGLLPRIAWLGLAVTDQYAFLADVGDVVRDAVAAAIRSEEYETAVQWAEQGRSIVWQNMLGLRTPVNDLHESHPDLARRLQDISRQMEAPALQGNLSNETDSTLSGDVAHRSSELARQWEAVVEEIRQIPGFQSFLKAKSFTRLAAAAHEGPVVILNIHKSRCDALVLVPDDSQHSRVSVINIPLEQFSYEISQKLFEDMKSLLSLAGVRARSTRKTEWVGSPTSSDNKFRMILRVLWLRVVKPVIEGLAFQPRSNDPPRIWWCATGALAFLPLHAAGMYKFGSIGENVSDYVVSSYIPTLTTILDKSEPTRQADFQLLTVAQPSTPYATPIPKTENEVKLVQRLNAGVRIVALSNENATVDRTLRAMTESNWIHLACHGQQSVDDPMKSGFLLHDRILELSEIVRVTLPKADFAYLSACQTAMGDEKVAEESVHLAAGMLLVGCRAVIATMWSIRDDDGPQVAETVYSRILKDGKLDGKEAAYALHDAVRQLRESGAGFLAWVPFIHIGR